MKLVLPGRKLLVVVLVLALVSPIHYALDFLAPPAGRVFLGYQDDVLMLTLMKSPAFGFSDPWSFDGGMVWHNPLIGSVYLFILLGLVPFVLGLNMYLAFIFFKFAFAIFYYIVVYNLICEFIKDRKQQDMAFVLFMLSAGIGGILYILANLIFSGSQYIPIIGFAFTREFDELAAVAHSLTHTFRLYYMIPEALGYLSIIALLRNKQVISGLLLGLVFLFYPMHGMAFSMVLVMLAMFRNGRGIETVKKSVKSLVPVFAVTAIFLIPWLIHYSQRPYYFAITKYVFEGVPTIQTAIGFFFPLLLAAYYFLKRPEGLMKNKGFVAAFKIMVILLGIQALYFTALTSTLFTAWLQSLGIYGAFGFAYQLALPIEIITLAMALVMISSLHKVGGDKLFLASWIILFAVAASFSTPSINYAFNPVRILPTIIFPLAILASFGMLELSARFKVKPMMILGVVILLSLPSILGYNFWLQKSIRTGGLDAFFTPSEKDALDFLASQPEGRVMSSLRYGGYIPYYTNKQAMLFSGRDYDGILKSVNEASQEFYNTNTSSARRAQILDNYEIKYVIVGPNEKGINLSGLKLIRHGDADIYTVG